MESIVVDPTCFLNQCPFLFFNETEQSWDCQQLPIIRSKGKSSASASRVLGELLRQAKANLPDNVPGSCPIPRL